MNNKLNEIKHILEEYRDFLKERKKIIEKVEKASNLVFVCTLVYCFLMIISMIINYYARFG